MLLKLITLINDADSFYHDLSNTKPQTHSSISSVLWPKDMYHRNDEGSKPLMNRNCASWRKMEMWQNSLLYFMPKNQMLRTEIDRDVRLCMHCSNRLKWYEIDYVVEIFHSFVNVTLCDIDKYDNVTNTYNEKNHFGHLILLIFKS